MTALIFKEGRSADFVDISHHNAFSLTRQYKAFADVVRTEGYQEGDGQLI